MSSMALLDNVRSLGLKGFGTPLLVLVMLVMMVLPLPTFLLDVLFTFNIATALLVLLAGVYCQRPLDFAVFPTVLLVSTLLRLSLNVASTRVVLLDGHTGTHAAGQVVESFGAVVIGGNYAVGLVVFAILVVINFVVVTKGAGRVSEVSARFTLDAMPGKQMAIDADLSAGIIGQDEARHRREEIAQEADFYGAMDGASKFVRGDAIAGILILVINILGGLLIGMLQHDMNFSAATHNYALLTIGDGLVAQIPSLLLSTAAAIMVTRVSRAHDMTSAMVSQMFQHPHSLYVAAAVIGGMGIIPGMPHIAFLGMASVAATIGYFLQERRKQAEQAAEKDTEEEEAIIDPDSRELNWEDVANVDMIGLEVGYRIIPLVDKSQSGHLLSRIKGVRKKLSQSLGFLIPSVHIRDNLDLAPNIYRITIAGVCLGEGELFPGKFMAINPGQVFGELEGTPGKEPAFGLDAIWINDDAREHAQSMGYTVVDASTVIATHLSQLLQEHAAQLMGHEEAQQLLDRLAESAPKLVQELVPDLLSLGVVVKVLQNLLQEGIPVRDMRTIAESLVETATRSKEPDMLTSQVRVALSRLIVQHINGTENELPIFTMQPDLEQILQNSLQNLAESGGMMEPSLAEKLQSSLQNLCQQQDMLGQPSVLVVQPLFRQWLAGLLRGTLPMLHVLSFHEIPDDRQIRIVGTVG